MEMEKGMLGLLAERAPHIHKFGIRICYIDELEKLIEKSNLAYFIPPQALVLDFPYWEHVAGRVFSGEDFPRISHRDGIKAMQHVLEKWGWDDVGHVPKEKIQNYVKVLARILWNIDGAEGREYPFSYSVLAKRNDAYTDIATAILNLKKYNWDEQMFTQYKPLFQGFVLETCN